MAQEVGGSLFYDSNFWFSPGSFHGMGFLFFFFFLNFILFLPKYKFQVKHNSGRRSVMSKSLQPHGLHSPWNSPGWNTGVGSRSLLQGNLPNSGIEPRSLALQADSVPSKPPGKPQNTGVGSISLLQGMFPTQDSNRGLLHCRLILYQLSY